MCKFFILGLAAVLLCASPALASANKPAEKTTPEKAIPATKRDQLDVRTDTLLKGLDENGLKQFHAIRGSHGTIRAVEDVQGSVGRAVEACVKKNPEISQQMTGRHDAWKAAIRPTIKKAKSKLDKMVLLQSFAKPSEMRSYLKLFDEAVNERNSLIKEVPMTEKAACLSLAQKMDQTEKDLVRLLTETLALDQDIQQKDL